MTAVRTEPGHNWSRIKSDSRTLASLEISFYKRQQDQPNNLSGSVKVERDATQYEFNDHSLHGNLIIVGRLNPKNHSAM